MTTAGALAATALLWLPGLVSIGDFSPAFLVPLLLLGWLMRPQAGIGTPGALAHYIRRGLTLEIACVTTVILLAALSATRSPEPLRVFRVVLPMIFGLGAMLVLPGISARQCRRLVYATIFSGATVVALALLLTQVASLRPLVTGGYRFTGFFDNANQLSLAVSAFAPCALALSIVTSRRVVKFACVTALLVLLAGLILSGGKTALAFAMLACAATGAYDAARDDRFWRALVKVGGVLLLTVIAAFLTLWLISRVSPVTFQKIAEIFTGGVSDYASIQSRKAIWEESVRLGTAHPLLGVGAGSHVLGVSHSHNLVLDYFRGMGVTGALMAALLFSAVTVRSTSFCLSTIGRGSSGRWFDTITASCYLGALAYLSGNMLSDSLSPSTSFLFWMVYISAYCSDSTALVERLRSSGLARERDLVCTPRSASGRRGAHSVPFQGR